MKQQGMALFQVLLMVAIFSILLLVMVGYSKQSIQQAQAAQDGIDTKLAMYSAANYLQFQLLTSDWLTSNTEDMDIHWNFYGQAFTLALPENSIYQRFNQPLQVQVQDERGLVDLRYPADNLEALLLHFGIPALDAASMRRTLSDAQRPASAMGNPTRADYPHLQLQSFSELGQLPGWNLEKVELIRPYSSLIGGIFNPATAPDGLLSALLPPAQVDIIRQWRQQGQFNVDRFSALTGLEQDEIVSFYPGNVLSIILTDPQSGATITLQVKLEPYSKTPLVLFSQHYGS